MTQEIYEQIIRMLRSGPQPLSRIHELLGEAGSDWTESQLRLFIECMNGIELTTGEDGKSWVRAGERTAQEELAAWFPTPTRLG